jgi:hypothetical protein
VVEKSSSQPRKSGVYGRPKAIAGAASLNAFTEVGKAPSVWPIRPVTPSLPLAPMPVGQATTVPCEPGVPSFDVQVGLVFVR